MPRSGVVRNGHTNSSAPSPAIENRPRPGAQRALPVRCTFSSWRHPRRRCAHRADACAHPAWRTCGRALAQRARRAAVVADLLLAVSPERARIRPAERRRAVPALCVRAGDRPTNEMREREARGESSARSPRGWPSRPGRRRPPERASLRLERARAEGGAEVEALAPGEPPDGGVFTAPPGGRTFRIERRLDPRADVEGTRSVPPRGPAAPGRARAARALAGRADRRAAPGAPLRIAEWTVDAAWRDAPPAESSPPRREGTRDAEEAV